MRRPDTLPAFPNGGRFPLATRLRRSASGFRGRDEVLVVLDQAVVSVGNFALSACIARTLPMAEFGLYMLVMSLVWVFMDLHAAVVTAPYVINRPKLPARQQAALFGSAVLHEGVVAATVMVAAAVIAATQGGAALLGAGTTAAAAFAGGALLLRDQTRRFFVAHGRLAECLAFDVAVVTLHGAGLLAAIASGGFSLAWGFAAAAFACAVPCALWLPRLGFLHGRVSLALKHWRLNWGVGRWMVLSGMMWSVATFVYPWTIAVSHGAAETGLWAAGLGLSSLCNVPLGGLQNYYGVKIARTGVPDLPREVAVAAIRLAGIAAAFAALFAAVGDRIMALLYGQRFVAAASLTLVMTLNLLVGTVSFCVSRALFILERGDADCMVNVIPLAAFALVGAWATVRFGPAGAAVSFLVSNALALAVRIAVLRRALRRAHACPAKMS